MDRKQWPVLKEPFAEVIAGRTRGEWAAGFDGSDACVTPVPEPDEVQENRHMKARDSFVHIAGLVQPRPAPRFSATRSADPDPGRRTAPTPARCRSDLGHSAHRIDELLSHGAVAEAGDA